MGNNTNDKYQPMKVDDKVQRKNDKTNHAYEVTKVIDKGSPDETEVQIKSTKNGHKTQLKQKSLKLCSDENPSSPIVQTDPSTQSETDSSTPVLTAVTSAPAAVSDVPHTPENAPTAAADKPAGTEPISTAPSSDAPVQTSENSLTPQTDDATNAINPSLPVSSSTLELKDIERIVDEAFVRRDAEMKAIPVLYSFVRGLVEKLTGKSDSLPNATGTSTKDLQTALKQLEAEVKKLEGEVKKLEGERDSAKGNALQLTDKLNTEKKTSGQSRSDLDGEKSRNKIAEDKWETEKGTLNGEIGSEKQRAGKAEAESKERQTKLEASEQRLKGALNDFWKGRQEFYGALHRGMEQFRGKNADRYEDAQESRQESIKSDTQLLKGLGCQVTLEKEAVNLEQLSYDGADHQPFGTETINHETDATVLLPGWSYPDGEIGAKPVLSGKEIKQ